MRALYFIVHITFPKSSRHGSNGTQWCNLGLLVDPVELGSLPADELTLLEPESNLLLGVLDAVGAVADVAADVDGEVTTDGAGGGGEGVGGTEDGCGRERTWLAFHSTWKRYSWC